MKTASENLALLPENCFGVLAGMDTLIYITAGESGYRKVPPHLRYNEPEQGETVEDCANRLNDADGVTRAQRAAMEHGSMWGWHTVGADPENYDADGTLNPNKLRAAIAAA